MEIAGTPKKTLLQEALEERAAEARKEAKILLKDKLQQLEKAEKVVRNIKRELEDLELKLSE